MTYLVELSDENSKPFRVELFHVEQDAESYATSRLGLETSQGTVCLARLFKNVDGEFIFNGEFEF